MRKVDAFWVLAALLLAGCERRDPDANGVDASNPLEIAARERGIVRPEADSPVGVFERRHDLGRDAMCVVPDGTGQWRFAITAAFGSTLSCAAQGTMVRADKGWRMRFAAAEGCEADVHEEDDELRLPGRLPPQCAKLCPSRASLAGLRLPRASWSADDARGLQIADRRGNIGRPCAD
ncbi:MAG: hypothetical protein RIA72_07425 [Sphingopyxis sp.]|uniref:hypothetical protein n=1 Tax=Sphingopyxis sp. TaxID=1908224 RepID=UPI0032EBB849